MGLLILLISIKLQMPNWYWVIFAILTLIRPMMSLIGIFLEDEIKKSVKEVTENK